MTELVFDEKAHKYTLRGREIPSVTRLLKDAGLIDDRWFSADGAKRGSYAHAALEFYDSGDLDESQLDPRLIPYLTAWRKFREQYQPEMLAIEERVFNEAYWYAGTLDRRVMMQGSEAILDIKTGVPMKHHGVQIALYRMCFPRVTEGMGVYLSESGYKVVEYHDIDDMSAAKAIVCLAAWKRKYGRGDL